MKKIERRSKTLLSAVIFCIIAVLGLLSGCGKATPSSDTPAPEVISAGESLPAEPSAQEVSGEDPVVESKVEEPDEAVELDSGVPDEVIVKGPRFSWDGIRYDFNNEQMPFRKASAEEVSDFFLEFNAKAESEPLIAVKPETLKIPVPESGDDEEGLPPDYTQETAVKPEPVKVPVPDVETEPEILPRLEEAVAPEVLVEAESTPSPGAAPELAVSPSPEPEILPRLEEAVEPEVLVEAESTPSPGAAPELAVSPSPEPEILPRLEEAVEPEVLVEAESTPFPGAAPELAVSPSPEPEILPRLEEAVEPEVLVEAESTPSPGAAPELAVSPSPEPEILPRLEEAVEPEVLVEAESTPSPGAAPELAVSPLTGAGDSSPAGRGCRTGSSCGGRINSVPRGRP